MSTKEIANQLVNLCRNGQSMEAVNALYAPNVSSVEMKGWPTEIVNGIDNIKLKHERFDASVETIHSLEVSEPLICDSHFTCTMTFDATFKERGRTKMSEICLYEVKEGKIVKEQFFYSTP